MKPERTFIAERPLAQHCPELLRPEPQPGELLPQFAAFGERLADGLASGLARLSETKAPAVKAAAPRGCSAEDLAEKIAPLAASTLFAAGPHGVPFLASIDAKTILRLVDRAFGGRGEVPSPLPEAFPLSAQLMIARLEKLVGNATAAALGLPDGMAMHPLRRDSSYARLRPFAPGEALMVLEFGIQQGEDELWTMTFAVPAAALGLLLGNNESRSSETKPRPRILDPLAEPFGDMPLTVSAVLVDMRIPFSTLSALEPGQVLPIAVARNIPLRIGDKSVAHGTIGEVDDRVAVQVTQAF